VRLHVICHATTVDGDAGLAMPVTVIGRPDEKMRGRRIFPTELCRVEDSPWEAHLQGVQLTLHCCDKMLASSVAIGGPPVRPLGTREANAQKVLPLGWITSYLHPSA
jgi:hypothetical protein